jgi:hypothetical protein
MMMAGSVASELSLSHDRTPCRITVPYQKLSDVTRRLIFATFVRFTAGGCSLSLSQNLEISDQHACIVVVY